MATHHIMSAAGLVFGLGLAAAPALAQQGGGQMGAQSGGQYGGQGAEQRGQYGGQMNEQRGQYGGQAGGQFGGQQEGSFGAKGPGFGAGAGGYTGMQNQNNVVAPIPQFWLADATLFIGNAANAAHTLSVEEGLNIQASPVLGDQAQFLIAATNRALTSLVQLQQNAEATDPSAVPSIRIAVGQLLAAKAMANQAAEAVNAGQLGPAFTTNVRATLAHLAAAEREMQTVGKAYGLQQFAAAGACSAGRSAAALGVGIGGTGRGTQKGGPGVQKGGTQQQQPGATPGGGTQGGTQQPGATPEKPEK